MPEAPYLNPLAIAALDRTDQRMPLRADVVELLRRAGVEFFRMPVAPEGEAMRAYFHSPSYIHCHFTPDWVADQGSALTLLQVFLSKVHPDDRDHMTSVAKLLLSSDGYSTDITSNRFRGVSETGQWCWYEVRMSVRWEDSLRICEGLMINVAEQEEARLNLERVAFEDRLTGLGNMAATMHTLDRLIQSAGRDGGVLEPFALIWLDLTGFGRVNSLMGRAKGDDLLSATAAVLREWIQDGDLVTRPNSDEFLVILPGRDSDAALAAAFHLQQQLPVRLLNHIDLIHGLTFQAGISSFPQHGQEADSLLSSAAAALDQSFRQGPGALVVYTDSITETARQALTLEQGLQQALPGDQLHLLFQPQVGCDGELLGCEALIRWQSPELGAVSPNRFIPLAEQTGQIHSIGLWVIEEACRRQVQFQEAGLHPPSMGINISAIQLADDRNGVASHLLNSLRRYGLAPEFLHVEITESGTLTRRGIEQLQTLHNAGVVLHIDDFGTGYASLGGLLKLPIHTLKLDQSFVKEMDSSEASVAILRACHALAGSVGMQTVVEGVEQVWQAERLVAMGYRQFQGFLFSEPVPAEAYMGLIRDPSPLSAWRQA